MVGALRLVRSGALQTGYDLAGGTWVPIHTGPVTTVDTAIKLATWSGYQFTGWDLSAAWDDVVINSGEIVRAVAIQPDKRVPSRRFSGGAARRGNSRVD